jgi:stringent starvation protein B
VFDGAVQAKWFGTTHAALTAAIAAAQPFSRVVELDAISYDLGTSTLNVPAGIALVGAGRGSIVNTVPTTGTILNYTGTGTAVSVNGTLAGLERLSVVGSVSALGAGILINGDGVAVESWCLRHVTIFGFTSGTGLKMQGINSGAVAYGCCVDLRIRHAKTGLWIVDVGGGAGFVNTNQFYGGAINGGGFDYAIRVQGGNDNRFLGMSVEPPSSTVGHIVVERGAIQFDGRLEGTAQPATVPMVDIQNGSDAISCVIAGLGGTGLVKNAAGANITMIGGKHAEPILQNNNLFNNAGFTAVNTSARTIEGWTVTETGGASTWTVSASEVVPGHNVIQVVVAAGASVELKPSSGTLPARPSTTTPVTFGIWVKTATAQAGYARINGAGGVTTSALHSGSGAWEAVSMAQNVSTEAVPDPRFVLDGGASGVTYSITSPYFAYGLVQPHGQHTIGQEGGTLYGTLEGGVFTVALPAAGSDSIYNAATSELTLPKAGNVFHITGTARTITRLNNLSASRMSKGTVIRLVFDISGVVVTDGGPGFIDLTAAFTSAAPATPSARSWLLLESNGDGTWYELDRRP